MIAIITAGKGKMPPQKDVLSTQEIADLADYVINLRNAQ
jgi:mono/diheme cytochrome c family protein